MTKMLKLYKEGNDFLRLCPNCRSRLNWARKKNGTIVIFPDYIDLNPNPLRPILNIYYILLNFMGIALMILILLRLFSTMQNIDRTYILLLLSLTFPFMV